jgi:DNA-binding transcriptional MerR regulator
MNTEEPVYNIGAVVQETGIPAATLRAWERRYGFPDPDRTGGGQRLYSWRDISALKWANARLRDGMRIGQAAELWHNLNAAGEDPLATEAASATVAPSADTQERVDELYAALTEMDASRAQQLIDESLATHSVETVCQQVFLPILRRIGNGWAAGDVTVQAEHFASNTIRTRLLSILHAAPAPTRTGRLYMGSAPGNWHEFGVLVLALMMQRRGWPVFYLGQSVAADRIAALLASAPQPALLVLSADRLADAAALLDIAAELAGTQPALPLAFGGTVFARHPELVPRIPGLYLGDDLGEAVTRLERALVDIESVPLPEAVQRDPASQAAYAAFAADAPSIRHDVLHQLAAAWPDRATSENGMGLQMVSDALLAALRLGLPGALAEPLEWAWQWLPEHGYSHRYMAPYIAAWRRAVQRHLPSDVAETVDQYLLWLDDAIRHRTEATGP